jgi:hypothetical protein
VWLSCNAREHCALIISAPRAIFRGFAFLVEIQKRFGTDEAARAYLEEIRWQIGKSAQAIAHCQAAMPPAKPAKSDLNFDEAMRKLMRVPPPPSGKKAKRKVKSRPKKQSR